MKVFVTLICIAHVINAARLPRQAGPLESVFLKVKGFKDCLQELTKEPPTFCYPPAKPENCQQDAYDHLATKFPGPVCGEEEEEIPGFGVAAPLYLEIKGHRDCLGEYSDGSATFLCFPDIKPENCDQEKYERVREAFLQTGEFCPADLSVETEPLAAGSPEDCLTPNGADLCLPTSRPDACPEALFESLKPAFEQCPEIPELAAAVAIGPLPVRPNPIRIPVQNQALRAEFGEGFDSKLRTFYQIWDKLLESDLAVVDDEATSITIITADNFAFNSKIPADAPSPFVLDDILQRAVIGDSIIKERIAPDDARLKDGLKVKTARGSVVNFKSDEEGNITVEGIPVKEQKVKDNAVVYVLEKLPFLFPKEIENALKRVLGN